MMSLTWRDGAATLLTGLAVLVFAASHESWDVWLVGSSYRWAAAAIAVVGLATCSIGAARREVRMDVATGVQSVIGVFALACAIWAIAAGSLTALTLLVLADVVLWLAATLHHLAQHPTDTPLTV